MNRRTLLSLLPAAAALAPRALRAQDTAPVTIATTPVDGGAAVYYANDLGIFKKHGLNVEVSSLTSGSAVAAGVASGTYDFAQSSLPPLIEAHARGIPFVLILPTSTSHVGDNPVAELVTLPTSPIRTGRDLNGKTLAVNTLSDLTLIATRAWIDANGGDSSTAHYLEVPFVEMWPAVVAGRVDAAFIATPALLTAQEAGARALAKGFGSIANTIAVNAWFTTKAYAAAHPDVVKNVVAALAEAGRWGNTHRAESAQILGKYSKLVITPTMARAVYGERLVASEIQPIIDLSVRYGLLKQPFAAGELFAPGLS